MDNNFQVDTSKQVKKDFLKKPVSSYSKGMRQRVSMARALISNPKLLFLLVGLGALLLVLIVVAPIVAQNLSQISPQIPVKEGVGNVQMVGYVLFTKFLIPFEIAAIMLLVAMIAGIILAGKGMRYSLTLGESEENQVKDKK